MKPRVLVGLMALVVLGAAGAVLAQQREVIRARHELDGEQVLVTATRAGFRFLRVGEDATLRGAVKVGQPGFLVLPYERTAMAALAFQEIIPRKSLFLGTAVGSAPRFLTSQFPEARVELVSEQELYLELASEHFGLDPDNRLEAKNSDLRKYATEVKKKYDLVVMDTFVDGSIPYRLVTRDILTEIWRRLEQGGMFVVHTWEQEGPPTQDEILATMQAVFGEVYMFEVPRTGSVILMGTRREGQVTQEQAVERAREIMQETPLSFDLPVVVARRYQYATKMQTDAKVLTDANAPLAIE